MKKDLCEIMPYYETDIDRAREMLYWTFRLIFNDAIKKKNLRLDSQELYTKDDLEWECFLAVDYFLHNISSNWRKKPVYKKKKIIWYKDIVMWCSEIKWYVYQTIARVIQDKATEKYSFKVPFNKNWTASQVRYQWWFDWMSVVTINNQVTYKTDDQPLWDIKLPFVEFWFDKEVEKQYLMSMIYNIVDSLSYDDKKLFVQRYTNAMSAESMAKDWWISKKSMLQKIHCLNSKIKKKIRDEKIDTWTFTEWIYGAEDIGEWPWGPISLEDEWD